MSIPTTKQLFSEMIPAELGKNPAKAREVNAVYCFKITGDGGGTWTVDLVADPPTCKEGDSGAAQCTIELANEDFQAMLGNPQLGMQLYFQGKLRVTGDPMLATKLQNVISMAVRPPTAGAQ